MTQSIVIVKYTRSLSVGQLFGRLSKNKFKRKYTDKNDCEKTIELEQEISELKSKDFGVQGHGKYYYQKENEFSEDSHFDITSKEFDFLFSPTSEIVILHCEPAFRSKLLSFFADILHSGNNPFENVAIKRDKLHELMWKILGMKSGKNNLEEAQFFHLDRPLRELKKLSFTTIPDACGTEHVLFRTHYDNCTHWNCTLRVFRCNGLLDDVSERGYLLRLTKDATASFTIDKTLTEWNRFVVETMKPILGF